MLRRLIGVLILVGMIGGGFALVPSSKQAEPNNQNQPASGEKYRAVGRYQCVAKCASEKNENTPTKKNNWYDTFVEHTAEWLVALFTAVLSAYTARLFYATAGLKLSTDNLWKAGELHSERELRAFVFVGAANIVPETESVIINSSGTPIQRPTAWRIGVVWQNGGSTRTKNMMCHISREFFDGEMPDDFKFPDHGDLRRFPVLLGPRANLFSVSLRFMPNDIRDVHAGTKHLYIYGWAEYDDIFPETPRHRTEFCFEVFFIGTPFPHNTTVTHQFHRLHNGADEECIGSLRTPR